MLGARAQRRLPAKKKAWAISMIGLRPQMLRRTVSLPRLNCEEPAAYSATVPQIGVTAVLARVKAPPTQT